MANPAGSEQVRSVRQARDAIDAELAAQQRVTVALWRTTRAGMLADPAGASPRSG